MKNLRLKSGALYVMVGLPASGKSGFLNNQDNIAPEMIISTDEIRKSFIGSSYKVNEDGNLITLPISAADNAVWDIAKRMLESRMAEGLTTFFDAASMVASGNRESLRYLAGKYGVEVIPLVLPIDPELSKKYDKKREFWVGGEVIDKFYNQFKESGGYNALDKEGHIKISFEDKISLTPNSLPHNKFDVVGDVHGLYDDFIFMLENELGYKRGENGLYQHPEGRKLFLLGDFLDRGQQSIEMLKFVYEHHKDGHKFILGNHENKLLNFLRAQEKGSLLRLSPSASLTASDFMKLKKDERKELHQFLLSLPKYFVHESEGVKIAFGHANLKYFNPLTTPSSYLMYSDQHKNYKRKKVTPLNEREDYIYSELFKRGLNEYYYVRGHIRSQYDDQIHVLSLDDRQAFDGHFVSVKLEDLEGSVKSGLGVNNKSIVRRTKTVSGFNFTDFEEENLKLFKIIQRLKKEKLAVENKSHDEMLSIFKYKKDVFFKRKWEQEADLLSCRGVVFDFAGRIVQYPFDKVFNYSEPNERGEPTAENVDKNTKFIVVEKLNGFLGNITLHPFKNDLLFSTTGSLTSDFVGYIQDMTKKDDVYGDLMSFFSKGNGDLTLMFEVIHPDDPHIVKYDESECGIYLIGARHKEYGSKLYTETELDCLAEEIGLRRPDWEVKTLGEALDDMKTVQHEGYMLRNMEDETIELKLKSSYYLGVKFISRMGDKKIRHMFKNPQDFKKNIDEEFFVLVDKITQNMSEEEFRGMDKEDRVDYVRNLMNKSYESHGLKNKSDSSVDTNPKEEGEAQIKRVKPK